MRSIRNVSLLLLLGIIIFTSCDGVIFAPNDQDDNQDDIIKITGVERILTETLLEKTIVTWELSEDIDIASLELSIQSKGDSTSPILVETITDLDTTSFEFTDGSSGYYTFTITTVDTEGNRREGESQDGFFLKSDLPVVYINTPDGLAIETKEWVNKDLERGSSTIRIENAGKYNLDVMDTDIKGRGNSTWGMPKKPYNIKLDKKNEILGMANHKKWVLLANYSDKSLVRTEFAFNLGNNVFKNLEWTPSLKSVELILNGEYVGVYQVVEKIELDKKRLNIKMGDEGKYDTGDFLLEVDERLDAPWYFRSANGVAFTFKEPDELTQNEFDAMQNIVQDIEDVLFSEDSTCDDIETVLDIDSFIDWYLVNELTKNNDAIFFSSVYMYYKQNDQKMYMGPLWDFDLSSGNINYNDCDKVDGFYIKRGGWYSQLFKDDGFKEAVKARWNNVKGDVLGEILSIGNITNQLGSSSTNNFLRWDILGTYVWPNRIVTGSYDGEVSAFIAWIVQRYHWLDGAIQELI